MVQSYSGNFALTAESCEAGTRLQLGIHPYHFAWTLAPGQSFAAGGLCVQPAGTWRNEPAVPHGNPPPSSAPTVG